MLSSRFYFRAEGEIALLIKFFCRKHEDVNSISKPTYKDGHGGVCLYVINGMMGYIIIAHEAFWPYMLWEVPVQ